MEAERMEIEKEILKAVSEIKKDVKYIKGAIDGVALLLGKIKEVKDFVSSKEFKKLKKALKKNSG